MDSLPEMCDDFRQQATDAGKFFQGVTDEDRQAHPELDEALRKLEATLKRGMAIVKLIDRAKHVLEEAAHTFGRHADDSPVMRDLAEVTANSFREIAGRDL